MALSDADGKIWVASTSDAKHWEIEKEALTLTGSVSSMVVKDGTLNFYYAKDERSIWRPRRQPTAGLMLWPIRVRFSSCPTARTTVRSFTTM